MKVIIDRFENDLAVVELEDKNIVHMSLSLVPSGAKEGDILKILIDKEVTKNRKKHIEKTCDGLWE